jgi:hypothetical protein
MYTLCTHCQVEYEVAPDDLVRGRGWLHCSACERDFDSLGNLSKSPRTAAVPLQASPSQLHELDDMPEGIEVPSVVEPGAVVDPIPLADEAVESESSESDACVDAEPSKIEPIDEEAVATDEPDPDPQEPEAVVADAHDEQQVAIAEEPVSTPPLPIVPAPSFAKRGNRIPVAAARRGQRWRWAAVVALAVLLVLQVALADRERFAADARTRPWMERLCGVLACELPPWREPGAMQLLARDVRPHPSVSDALIISASFRNDARWAQSWPELNLTLSDINGKAIAQRQFAPDEYLGLGARDLIIKSGQTASVTLEVTDPGKQAVAFEFEFR